MNEGSPREGRVRIRVIDRNVRSSGREREERVINEGETIEPPVNLIR